MKIMLTLSGALPLLMGMSALGCAADGQSGAEPPEEGTTGEVSQEISGWAPGQKGTTTSLTAMDTGWSQSNSTCFLSGIAGNLSEGRAWQLPQAVKSAVSISVNQGAGPGNANWGLVAHGGAYVNQHNQRVWENNPVLGRLVCVPYGYAGSDYWESYYSTNNPEPVAPKRIMPIMTSNTKHRQCFLSGISGGYGLMNKASTYARVVEVQVPDAKHPQNGWYVESNGRSDVDGGHLRVDATCFDFPWVVGSSGLWAAAVPGPSSGTTTFAMTNEGGVKACGLTGIQGAFTANSYSNGALLNPPSAQNGNWSMTVSAGKWGVATCIR